MFVDSRRRNDSVRATVQTEQEGTLSDKRRLSDDGYPDGQVGDQLRNSRMRERIGLFVLSCFAGIYVWSLPALANWCGFPDADGSTCFAYRCEGYPACNDSAMGVSVSGYIMTPPATGMMMLTFMWPMLHLFRIDEYVVNAHIQRGWTARELVPFKLSMYFYLLAFGLFCTCTCNYFPVGHNTFMGITFLTGATHYVLVMRYVGNLKLKVTAMFVGFAILCFTVVVIVNVSGVKLKEINPYLFYSIEALGLSCMAAYPNIFELERYRLQIRKRLGLGQDEELQEDESSSGSSSDSG